MTTTSLAVDDLEPLEGTRAPLSDREALVDLAESEADLPAPPGAGVRERAAGHA